jgi:hypothetical protein
MEMKKSLFAQAFYSSPQVFEPVIFIQDHLLSLKAPLNFYLGWHQAR